MARFIGIIGDTGSGKTRSIVNLDPKSTIVIKVLGGKDLPFKESSKKYNAENKNIFKIDEYDDLTAMLLNIDTNAKHVNTIVIDDMRFLMTKEFFSRATETGYGKFSVMGKNFQNILKLTEGMREELNIFGFFHDEDVLNDRVIVAKKIKLVGKMVDDHYNPIEVMTIALWCKPTVTKDGVTYKFLTNRCLIDGVEIPAKSPEGMFEKIEIPNDLKLVLEAVKSYY